MEGGTLLVVCVCVCVYVCVCSCVRRVCPLLNNTYEQASLNNTYERTLVVGALALLHSGRWEPHESLPYHILEAFERHCLYTHTTRES